MYSGHFLVVLFNSVKFEEAGNCLSKDFGTGAISPR